MSAAFPLFPSRQLLGASGVERTGGLRRQTDGRGIVATSVGDVLGMLRVAMVPGDPALSH